MSTHDDPFARTPADTVSFDFLGEDLGHDVNEALGLALQAGVVFPKADEPLALFRQAIADAIGQIAGDVRWDLFQRFLKHGPQDVEETAPKWLLPRGLRWRQEGKVRVPEVVPGSPPNPSDEIIRVSDTEWRVVLRWSRETLAAAAYEMTFWFMSKLGEIIYQDGVPPEWSEMTPAEAGYNAAKEKLHYAIRPYAVKAEESKESGKPTLTRKEVLEMGDPQFYRVIEAPLP